MLILSISLLRIFFVLFQVSNCGLSPFMKSQVWPYFTDFKTSCDIVAIC